MTARNYSNTAPPVALTTAATSGATSLVVASTTGYPAAPFLLGLERGTANEEVALCTAISPTTFTVTRGYDGTSAKAHAIGTSVEHTVSAIDYREANNYANLQTAKGDLVTHDGTNPARESVGADDTVLLADSNDPNGIRWGTELADLTAMAWMECGA